MEIYTNVLGDYQTNSYCVTATEQDKNCLIIDTGLSAQPLVDFIKQRQFDPQAVIFTHGHADHIAGLKLLLADWPDITVAIHRLDADMLTNPIANLSAITGAPFRSAPADMIIEDEGRISLAGMDFEVFHTPGHTPGGICLYSRADGILFSGDTLFAGSIGRTDFPGGDFGRLIAGIKTKLLLLPDETKVYTGHGPATTIAEEKQFNQFLTD